MAGLEKLGFERRWVNEKEDKNTIFGPPSRAADDPNETEMGPTYMKEMTIIPFADVGKWKGLGMGRASIGSVRRLGPGLRFKLEY